MQSQLGTQTDSTGHDGQALFTPDQAKVIQLETLARMHTFWQISSAFSELAVVPPIVEPKLDIRECRIKQLGARLPLFSEQ